MDTKDYGKTAVCGVNGDCVIVSLYNYKCPCLDCVGCKNTERCSWRHVLETNPCADDEMRALLCKNCMRQK